MPRKSSIHFVQVTNIQFAVSHSERTELSEPGYLLPKEHQLPNVVVDGSLSENDLAALFIQQKERMTGQAKARGSSPFWEGVVVLGNTNSKEQSANLLDWKKAYEQATGHRVLHMSIHLDEGYVDATGHPQYNPHAHVIVSRMNEQNRVIKLERKQLAAVQDLTAEALKMERGSTLAERGGKRGRRHVGHREYRTQADEARLNLEKPKADLARLQKKSKEWSDADLAKIKGLEAKLAESELLIAQLKAEYAAERAALKASGEAKQADYQQLKKVHEKALDELTASKAQAADLVEQLKASQEQAAQVPDLVNKLKAQATINGNLLLNEDAAHKRHLSEIERLKAEYAAERAALKASGEATQRDYQQLKQQHEAALGKLATAQTEAGKVPELVEQVKALKPEADKVPGLLATWPRPKSATQPCAPRRWPFRNSGTI